MEAKWLKCMTAHCTAPVHTVSDADSISSILFFVIFRHASRVALGMVIQLVEPSLSSISQQAAMAQGLLVRFPWSA